jgi:uncharacterized membrane protein
MLPLLTLLALVLRLYKLTYWDYWDDEVISTFAARPPLNEILSSVMANDVHPPLYHMLLHIWMGGFGESLLAIRFLSVLFSTACVPLMYVLGRNLTSRSVALVAAALLAIAPFQVYHGQQARMYPLLTLIVLVTTLAFVHAWWKGGWLRWLVFGLCVTAGFYTHVYFPFSLLALNLWAVYDTWRQRRIYIGQWIGIIGAQLLGVVLFLPFLAQMFNTTSRIVSQGFWIKGGTEYLDWMYVLVSLSNHATILHSQRAHLPSWYLLALYGPAVAVIIVALVYSLRRVRHCPKEQAVGLLLLLLVGVPIVTAVVVSLIFTPILLDRSLIGISSALFLLIAWVAVRFWEKRLIQIVMVLFVASSWASLAYAYPNTPQQNQLIRMADYIMVNRQPGDAIAVADWQSFDTTVLRYPDQRHLYILPGPDGDTSGWERRIEMMRWHSPQNVQPVADFAPEYRRVWLVLTNYTYNRGYHQEVNQGWLESHGRLVEERDFKRAVVYLYALELQE